MLENLKRILEKTKTIDGLIIEEPTGDTVYSVIDSDLSSSFKFFIGTNQLTKKQKPHYHVKTDENIEVVPTGPYNFGFGDHVQISKPYYLGIFPGKPRIEKKD